MKLAESRATAQGRAFVPAAVRKHLDARPGGKVIWEEEDGKIVVRRAGEYTFEDMRKVLFGNKPPAPKTLKS